MSDTSRPGSLTYATPARLLPPDLKPRRGLFWTTLAIFALWVALLAWLYVSQILMKRG